MMQRRQLKRKGKKKSDENFAFLQCVKVGLVKVFQLNCIMLFLSLPSKVPANTCKDIAKYLSWFLMYIIQLVITVDC